MIRVSGIAVIKNELRSRISYTVIDKTVEDGYRFKRKIILVYLIAIPETTLNIFIGKETIPKDKSRLANSLCLENYLRYHIHYI